MKWIVLLGRILFAAIFILLSVGHFSKGGIDYAATHGVPMAGALVPISGILALLGGLSILIGYKARVGAWLIVIFLVIITCTMHRFWAETDPMHMQLQMVMFLKNICMLGGALLITYFGAGPLSIDHRSKR